MVNEDREKEVPMPKALGQQPKTAGWLALEESITQQLKQLAQQNQLRHLSPPATTLDFTSNDYLGLRSNAAFQERCRRRSQTLPVGAGASRLLGGEHPIFEEAEKVFATFKGAESALFFSSGYAANEAVFTALNQPGTHLFSDSLNHASMIDGMRLGRWGKERLSIVPHLHLQSLEDALQQAQATCPLIAIESVFSMDGDVAALKDYAALAAKYHGVLVIDEAHALGVLGERGSGALEAAGLSHEGIITVNPCGKAMAASGAFVCGPRWFRDYLINTARPFIFSTGPSPWTAAALIESVQTISYMQTDRDLLQEKISYVRAELQQLGYEVAADPSPIIPVIIGSNENALQAATFLSQRGFHVKAVRPPTVPENTARLRLSLTASMQLLDLQCLLAAFAELRGTR